MMMAHRIAAVGALWQKIAAALAAGLMVASCAALPGFEDEPVTVYLLEWQDDLKPTAPADIEPCASLLIISPLAAPGYATTRMAYVQQPHRVEYFVKHRWADTPARMLAPLMTRALAESGLFKAVVENPAPIQTQLRLESELLKLRQVFRDRVSEVELSLRVNLYDLTEGRVLASRVFNAVAPAASRDPYGGVVASHRALDLVFQQLTDTLADVLTDSRFACGGRFARSSQIRRK